MSKIFIDTNILIYSLDNFDLKKNQKSRQIILTDVHKEIAVISTQVLQELYIAGTTKLNIDPILMKSILSSFENLEVVIIDADLIKEAIDTSILNRISFWDALIVAAAECAKCEYLYTEDLNSGQIIRGVKVENPYRN